jgi:hypothetical protein
MQRRMALAAATLLCLGLGLCGTQAAAETNVDQQKALEADNSIEVIFNVGSN